MAQNGPRVRIIGGRITGNAGNGIRIGSGADVYIDGTDISGNGQDGVRVRVPASEDQQKAPESDAADDWHNKPIGKIGLAVASTLIAAAAIWAITHYLT